MPAAYLEISAGADDRFATPRCSAATGTKISRVEVYVGWDFEGSGR
jgi:hypothetical protein